MSVFQTIFEALESLAANKMRSGLTVLGIVIGVAAVIAMMAIGQGAQNSITGQIQGIGTNLLFIMSGNQQQEVRNAKPLTLADAQAIADPLAAPSVLAVAPQISANLEVSVGKESSGVSISGVTPEFAAVTNEIGDRRRIYQPGAHAGALGSGGDRARHSRQAVWPPRRRDR